MPQVSETTISGWSIVLTGDCNYTCLKRQDKFVAAIMKDGEDLVHNLKKRRQTKIRKAAVRILIVLSFSSLFSFLTSLSRLLKFHCRLREKPCASQWEEKIRRVRISVLLFLTVFIVHSFHEDFNLCCEAFLLFNLANILTETTFLCFPFPQAHRLFVNFHLLFRGLSK